MIALFTDPTLRAWVWLVSGLVLLGLELLTTTTLLLWPALGALVTAVVLFAIPDLATSWQIVLFGLVALVAAVAGRRLVKRWQAQSKPAPPLNAPEALLVGRTLTARPADSAGRGSVLVDGMVWSARQPNGDAPASGATVRVLAVDGATLVVEPVPPASS